MYNPHMQSPRLRPSQQASKACPNCHRITFPTGKCQFCGASVEARQPVCSHHGETLVDGRCAMCDLELKYEAPSSQRR